MNLAQFKKKHDYLVCIDSDGCAMDTMNIKHFRCFGPCLVEEWNLDEYRDIILKRWNEINLYTLTRGINRFKGLAKMLREVNDTYIKIEGIEQLEHWTQTTKELSNNALENVLKDNDSLILNKALSWSRKVNESIDALSFDEKRPFEGVLEAIQYAHSRADIAIVSSANLQAVLDEWEYYHLLDNVDIVLAQDVGSKAYCISELLKKGYEPNKVLMSGDALGDLEAAEKNDVFYFPILVNKEKESWKEFYQNGFNQLIDGTYDGEYQQKKIQEFKNNLK